jgi:hypothetical protein
MSELVSAGGRLFANFRDLKTAFRARFGADRADWAIEKSKA